MELPHLTPEASDATLLSREERVKFIRSDHWIDYPWAGRMLALLGGLLDHPRTVRMPSIAIYADSGMGKTMLRNRFLAANGLSFDHQARAERTPVLSIQMAARPSEKRLYSQLLDAIGAPSHPRVSLSDVEQVALRLLRQIKLKMLIIDEAHNLLAATYRDQRALLNLIRFISNELQISIVCLGVIDAREVISGDVQLARRFEEYSLPRWQANDEYQVLVISILRGLPLREPSTLSARALKRLLQASDGVTSELFKRLQKAAVLALETGREAIDDALLDAVLAPDERMVRYA